MFCFYDFPGSGEWSYSAIRLLIELYRENNEEFKKHTRKAKDVWKDISTAMAEHGYNFDGDKCDQKWRSLRQRYDAVKLSCHNLYCSYSICILHSVSSNYLNMDKDLFALIVFLHIPCALI